MKYVLPFFCVVTQIFAQNYDVASIPESLKKNANVVVRSHTTEYFINSIDNMEVKQTEVKTIMNRSGDDQAKVFIPYSKSEKVSNIKVTLYNASGKELKTYGKRDFSDYSHTPSFGLYVDNRILVLDASQVLRIILIPSKFLILLILPIRHSSETSIQPLISINRWRILQENSITSRE